MSGLESWSWPKMERMGIVGLLENTSKPKLYLFLWCYNPDNIMS